MAERYKSSKDVPARGKKETVQSNKKQGSSQRATAQDRPSQARSAQDRSSQHGTAQDRPPQARSAQDRPPQRGTAQERQPQARSEQDRSFQRRPSQGRDLHARPSQGGAFHSSPSQGRPVQTRPAPAPAPVQYDNDEREAPDNLIEGRNPVMEAMKSGRTVEKLLIARGGQEGSVREILRRAKEKKIIIQEVDRQRLDELSHSGTHQGVMAYVTPYQYVEVDDILQKAKEKGETPFLIILDEITDPHNLGAVIRTAECCGAHGVVIPKRRAVGLSPAAIKASAGAVEYMPVAKVTNIVTLLDDLKRQGIWIAGADVHGQAYTGQDFKGAIALVIGSEGQGIGRLIKEKCDFLVKIPIQGRIDSLNASVAAGILMYEVVRQRG